MTNLNSWGALYEELSQMAGAIESINWIDLWHNQVGFLVEEHPFPTPALFFTFRILNIEDTGERVQQTTLQVDMYYFYETFLDTFQGAYNKADAIAYLDTLTEIHRVFHGASGNNFTEMSRTGFAPVDTGSAGNLYRISFNCNAVDFSAAVNYQDVIPGEFIVEKGARPGNLPGSGYIL